ncbi:MAG: MarR family transcriptional regulator [Desulfarculus sp.]|nr:MarR family transcriptional regulator [Desulfarculus sp.]
MESFEDCIVFQLAKAYQRAHGILKEHLRPYGLTSVQRLILGVLEEEDGLAAGEIGQRLVLDSATLSGILERMADNGWISKEPDPNDRRVVRIFTTAKAKGLVNELRQAVIDSNQAVLSPLSLEEKILLKRLLRDLR